jgi:hypothetical protein
VAPTLAGLILLPTLFCQAAGSESRPPRVKLLFPSFQWAFILKSARFTYFPRKHLVMKRFKLPVCDVRFLHLTQ